MISWILFVLSLITLILSLLYFFLFFQEQKAIKKTVFRIINAKKITEKKDLVKLKNFLQQHISFEGLDKNAKRPLLRATAVETLKTGKGFCGENTRLAILLLISGGLKANRIYLFGKSWQHVVCEHEWEGQYYLFDGHNDEKMALDDALITQILSKDIKAYPNKYPTNPWQDYARIKLFYKIPFLRKYSKIRLPRFFVLLFENPSLLKAFFFLGLSIITIIAFIIFK
jgi:hypothetical protein